MFRTFTINRFAVTPHESEALAAFWAHDWPGVFAALDADGYTYGRMIDFVMTRFGLSIDRACAIVQLYRPAMVLVGA